MDWDMINTRKQIFGVDNFSEEYIEEVHNTFFEITKY
jgi:hypothetical protein